MAKKKTPMVPTAPSRHISTTGAVNAETMAEAAQRETAAMIARHRQRRVIFTPARLRRSPRRNVEPAWPSSATGIVTRRPRPHRGQQADAAAVGASMRGRWRGHAGAAALAAGGEESCRRCAPGCPRNAFAVSAISSRSTAPSRCGRKCRAGWRRGARACRPRFERMMRMFFRPTCAAGVGARRPPAISAAPDIADLRSAERGAQARGADRHRIFGAGEIAQPAGDFRQTAVSAMMLSRKLRRFEVVMAAGPAPMIVAQQLRAPWIEVSGDSIRARHGRRR